MSIVLSVKLPKTDNESESDRRITSRKKKWKNSELRARAIEMKWEKIGISDRMAAIATGGDERAKRNSVEIRVDFDATFFR